MPSHLPRYEIVHALRESLAVAKARRDQWGAPLLPLFGDVRQESQSGDVVKMLRDGQVVAVSATLLQEIVNILGDERHYNQLPEATEAQRRRLIRPVTPV